MSFLGGLRAFVWVPEHWGFEMRLVRLQRQMCVPAASRHAHSVGWYRQLPCSASSQEAWGRKSARHPSTQSLPSVHPWPRQLEGALQWPPRSHLGAPTVTLLSSADPPPPRPPHHKSSLQASQAPWDQAGGPRRRSCSVATYPDWGPGCTPEFPESRCPRR